jgi:hypothetical protein
MRTSSGAAVAGSGVRLAPALRAARRPASEGRGHPRYFERSGPNAAADMPGARHRVLAPAARARGHGRAAGSTADRSMRCRRTQCDGVTAPGRPHQRGEGPSECSIRHEAAVSPCAPAHRPPQSSDALLATRSQPGDCESGGHQRKRGTASHRAHTLPMQDPGQERLGRADARRPTRGSRRGGPRLLFASAML